MKKIGIKQAGISLLEVLLSLGIIAITLVMVLQYFGSATSTQKLNTVRNIIGVDVSAIQLWGSQHGTFSDLDSMDTLIQKGYISSNTKNVSCDNKSTSCRQLTPWQQEVSVSQGGGNSSQIILNIPLPTTNLCNAIQESFNDMVPNGATCSDNNAKIAVDLRKS